MQWLDIEDIAEALEDAYPEQDVVWIRFTELRRLVLTLEGFVGTQEGCNERILESIQASWLQLRE